MVGIQHQKGATERREGGEWKTSKELVASVFTVMPGWAFLKTVRRTNTGLIKFGGGKKDAR